MRKEVETQSPILLPPHLKSHYQSDLPGDNTYLQKPDSRSRIFHIENSSSVGSFVSNAGNPQQTEAKSILQDKLVQQKIRQETNKRLRQFRSMSFRVKEQLEEEAVEKLRQIELQKLSLERKKEEHKQAVLQRI